MRLNARAPIVIRGDEITHLDADGYKHLPRAASLPDGKILASSGGTWKPSDLSGVSVSSVFGRTGAVVAQTGDYTAAQVGAEPAISGGTAEQYLNGLKAWANFATSVRDTMLVGLSTASSAIITFGDTVLSALGKLQAQITLRLPINNPTFTGTMQGQYLRISSLASGLNGVPVSDFVGTLSVKTADQFRAYASCVYSGDVGQPNGIASLDATGRVPSGQLPSYVDDVIEATNFAALPGTGEAGKIYITLDDNKTWRWSGSGYAEISASLALGGTASTAHRGDHGVIAYAHSQVFSGNPHGTTPDDIGAFAKVFVGGGIDFHGFATPGVYEIRGNSWANGWAGLTGTQDVALLQMHDADGRRFLVAGDGKYGGLMLKFQASEIPGDHWSPWFTVWDSGSLPASTVGKAVLAAASQAAARAAIGAAPLPSKVDVSTSGNLGDISASTIKVTASGVTLALTGGIDGQGWDIVNPIYDVDFQLPSGVTLFRDGGTTLGPGTYTLGYNRAIRMVRVDASTWMLPNLW